MKTIILQIKNMPEVYTQKFYWVTKVQGIVGEQWNHSIIGTGEWIAKKQCLLCCYDTLSPVFEGRIYSAVGQQRAVFSCARHTGRFLFSRSNESHKIRDKRQTGTTFLLFELQTSAALKVAPVCNMCNTKAILGPLSSLLVKCSVSESKEHTVWNPRT